MQTLSTLWLIMSTLNFKALKKLLQKVNCLQELFYTNHGGTIEKEMHFFFSLWDFYLFELIFLVVYQYRWFPNGLKPSVFRIFPPITDGLSRVRENRGKTVWFRDDFFLIFKFLKPLKKKGFRINLNKYFWEMNNFFEITLLFVKISTHNETGLFDAMRYIRHMVWHISSMAI